MKNIEYKLDLDHDMMYERTGQSMVMEAVINHRARITEQIQGTVNRSVPVLCTLLRMARQRGLKTKKVNRPRG